MKDIKYTLLNTILTTIKSDSDKKNKFIKIIKNINTELSSNIIIITDYEVTSKISQYHLNSETPLIRNSNTYCIHSEFASYIYNMIHSLLLVLNYGEVCTKGEYVIAALYLYTITDELSELLNEQHVHLNHCNPVENIQELIIGLIDNTLDEVKYNHLFLENNKVYEKTKTDNNQIGKILGETIEQNIIDDEFIETNTNDSIYKEELFTSEEHGTSAQI
jgi:hypothetical protein